MPNIKEKLLKLVDDYGNACLRAGQSNSGYCIDPSGSHQWERMQKLRKELQDGIQSLAVSPTEER
jgi:hypothetical protein